TQSIRANHPPGYLGCDRCELFDSWGYIRRRIARKHRWPPRLAMQATTLASLAWADEFQVLQFVSAETRYADRASMVRCCRMGAGRWSSSPAEIREPARSLTHYQRDAF